MGKKCKYNGGDNYDPFLESLLKDDEVILICPETEGGLPVPRNPVELNGNKALDREGNDYTSFFSKGVEIVVEKAEKEQPDAFILQPRSPTCGYGFIYDGTFSKTLIKGNGLLVQKLLDKGYKINVHNLRIRVHGQTGYVPIYFEFISLYYKELLT